MIGELPKSLEICGRAYSIRTDFRVALTIFQALEDPELDDREKQLAMLECLYDNPENIPDDSIGEALEKAAWFLDGGNMPKKNMQVKTLDWEQDESMIFSAVNKTAGREVRLGYMHWWTFLGYFAESGETLLQTVMHLRQKMSKGKTLEKWERDFVNEHRELVIIQHKKTEEEKAEDDFVNSLFGQ